jgi:signal transduction histidine kinase
MRTQRAHSAVTPDFRLIFESAPGLYLVVAPDLTIVAATDAYLMLSMTSRDKIVGRDIVTAFAENPDGSAMVSPRSLMTSVKAVFDSGITETMPIQKWKARSQDSQEGLEERFWAPINTPMFDSNGNICCVIHRVEDVTALVRAKRSERDMERLVEEQRTVTMRMEAEAFNRTEELLATYRQLQDANASHAKLVDRLEAQRQELQTFSYSVSHDLRVPLRQISGLIETLGRHSGPSLDTEGAQHLRGINSAVKELDTLIEDLLNFSLVSQAEMRITTVDLASLAQDVVDHLSHQDNGPLTHWTIGDLPAVRGDAAMLRVVFVNLVSNALKFASRRVERRIEIGSATSVNETDVVFYVRDNGVGFDMDCADKLFGVFERLHSEDNFEGKGVGLATVRRIIHKHGGRAWAASASDEGATFYCSLPGSESNQNREEDNSESPIGRR